MPTFPETSTRYQHTFLSEYPAHFLECDIRIIKMLQRCGCQKSPFSEAAIDAIFKNTAGVPRLIEALAIKTMTVGMHAKMQALTEEQVYQAAKEL